MTIDLTALPADWSYLISILLVCLYASTRFNTPRTVKSETGRLQYLSSWGAYIASCAGLFIFLTALLRADPTTLDFLAGGPAPDHAGELGRLAAPFVAALILTTLLPSFPLVQEIDARLLKLFHRMASIPLAAQRLANHIDDVVCHPNFAIHPSLLADARGFILNSPALPSEMEADLRADGSTDSARYRFTRNLALYCGLKRLDATLKFTRDYPEEIAALERKIADFFAQSAGFFAFTHLLDSQGLAMVPESIRDARVRYKGQCAGLYDELRLLLARVLFYGCRSEREIVQHLNALGIPLRRPQPIHLPWNYIALDGLGVVGLFAAAALATSGQMMVGTAIFVGLLVAATHSLAAAFAVLPKQVWCFADRRYTGERPYLAYLISALCTFTISTPLALAFHFLRLYLTPDDRMAHAPFLMQCKWLLLAAILSAALAWACDNYVRYRNEPGWLFIAEGVSVAALMVLSGFIVLRWLLEGGAHPPGSLSVFGCLSALIGFLFGATIPRWYRLTLRRVGDAAPAPVAFGVYGRRGVVVP